MSITTTRFNQKLSTDGITFSGDADFTITNAALSAVYDPAKDVTSVEVINSSTDHGLQITLVGADATGADVILGVQNTKVGDIFNQNFDEYLKKNSSDIGQRINRIEVAALNATTGALAVTGDILADFLIEINVNNR